MNIMAYRFGKGEKTCAVVGALRGDEVQQLYVCARLVSFLREVEKEDGVQPGKSVMIVPTVIGASMNEGSRLWEPENMDINRRFPGDVTGSTTERIAGALLTASKIIVTACSSPASISPARCVRACAHDGYRTSGPDLGCESACRMSMSHPRSYDQTTLNYKLRAALRHGRHIPSTRAKRGEIDEAAADQTLRAIVRFLNSRGVIRSGTAPGHPSTIITNGAAYDFRRCDERGPSARPGIKFAGAHVRRGEQLAFIINPCDGSVREVLKAPVTGMLFFMLGRSASSPSTARSSRCSRGRKAMTKSASRLHPHAAFHRRAGDAAKSAGLFLHAHRYHDDRQHGATRRWPPWAWQGNGRGF